MLLFLMLLSTLRLPSPTQLPQSTGSQQVSAPSTAAVELEISGPRLIRAGDNLKFRAFLVNRSSKVIAFPSPTGHSPSGYYGPALQWRITRTDGRILPSPRLVYCPVVGPPRVVDDNFVFLQPGEQVEIAIPFDPSDYFIFPGKGFYRVSLQILFTPPSAGRNADGSLRWFSGVADPSAMSPDRLEKVMRSPRIEATSNTWTMYLSE